MMPMVPVAGNEASESNTVPLEEEYLKKSYSALHWITLHFSSPSLQTVPSTLSNVQTHWTPECGPSSLLFQLISHESVFKHHHAENTDCWCYIFDFCYFLDNLQMNATAQWYSCQCVTFSVPSVSLMQVPVSSLHYTSPEANPNKECPTVQKKVLVTI